MQAQHLPGSSPAPLAGLPLRASQHLRIALFGVIARMIESCTRGDVDAAIQAHPFLSEYVAEMALHVDVDHGLEAAWRPAQVAWEDSARAAGARLPLHALHHAGVAPLEIELLLAVGLAEEDPRFSDLFEQLQGGQRRPTLGLLTAWWRDDAEPARGIDAVRRAVQRLLDLGLLLLPNPDAARSEWAPAANLPVWDALRGDLPSLPWLAVRAPDALPALDDLILPDETRHACAALPTLLDDDDPPVVLLRGPEHNGRKTLAGALARALGRPLLLAREALPGDDARWRTFGLLATALRAIALVQAELAPGETRSLPAWPLGGAALVVATGRHGAWRVAGDRAMLALHLELPAEPERLRHWQAALPGQAPATLAHCAAQMRLTGGSIRAAAACAAGLARLAGRQAIAVEDIRAAGRTLQSGRLETLATRLHAGGALTDLSIDEPAREELSALLARCRWREVLAQGPAQIAAGNVGVRALFAGPSGTGKTLAARLLGAELGKDVWRVDLAATVDKYIGETEKNLDRVLRAAEELDVVLLLDEGDALMAGRTDVGSSNDRYANLETNFLLQRIEHFEGILLVTSNAADRIDRAFARRMDVVVNFRVPDEWQRYLILSMHLGADHGVDDRWLQDATRRCALSGGQWRNVATHARLLALHAGDRGVGVEHLQAALAREYRKTGGSCPLRPVRSAEVIRPFVAAGGPAP